MLTDFSIASPILGVPRVRPAAEYYRDVLGFSLDPDDGVFQPAADRPDGVYAIVRKGVAAIHLQFRPDGPPPNRPSRYRDVYLIVGNVDARHADLVRRGANMLSEPQDTPYGMRECVVEDLNGYRIVFASGVS